MLRALLALSLAGVAAVDRLAAPGVVPFVPAAYDVVWSTVFLLALAGIALVVIRAVAAEPRREAVPETGQTLEARLADLDRLHVSGRISDAERAEARARLLGTL